MVSVIVPMYNAENYILRCLESIATQSYCELEVIVVDDGSADESGVIADGFAARNSRFEVIHQDNHGLVFSRKQGILRANGKYVLYVDSDDYIDPEMIKELVGIAEDCNADAVLSGAKLKITDDAKDCRCIRNYADEGLYEGERLTRLKQQLFCAEDYCTMAVLPYLWNKLWRTEVIKEFVLKCDESIKVGEDVAIGFPALLAVEKLVVTNKAYYNYCQYPDSMMRGERDEEAEYENAMSLYGYLLRSVKDTEYAHNVRQGLDRYLINQLFTRCYGKANRILGCKGLAGFTKTMPESLAIYGAGELGKAVYQYARNRCHVKTLVDREYEYYQKLGYDVESPDECELGPDNEVIIAVFNKKAADAARKMLIDKGCSGEKIYSFAEIKELRRLCVANNG